MKKYVTTLLLTLVMALGLCASAAAAEPSLSGSLGDGGQLSWRLEDGALSIQADQPWTGQVMAACYQSGRLSQVKVLTPDQPTAQVGDRVNLVKLFWLGEETFAPQCEVQRTVVAPDKVFVDGIQSWYNLVNKNSVYYVADAFAPTYICSLNGVDTETDAHQHPTALADAAAKRGAVTQVFVNEQRQIDRVNCYDYTVTKLTGDPAARDADGVTQVRVPGVIPAWTDADKVSGWEGLAEGDVVLFYFTRLSDHDGTFTIKKAEKLTGTVSVFWSNGDLSISGTNGARYPATGLTVEGCDIPISSDAFSSWLEYGSFRETYDFYLDPSGAICWIDHSKPAQDTTHQPCLPLSATVKEGSLQVLARFGVRTDVLTVTRLDGRAIGDGPDRVSLSDALAQVEGDCEKAFYTYSCQASDGYYHLVRASKDSPVDTGCTWGESYLIPEGTSIQPAADFTSGAIPCRADADTVFGLAVGAPEDKTFIHCRGFQDLPSGDYVQTKGCVITRPDGVADIVYLDVASFGSVEQPVLPAPQGCVLVADNCLMIDPELYHKDIYQIKVVDVEGYMSTLQVPESIAQAVRYDSMRLDRFDSNAYAGKLCRITEMGQNGTARALEPVETYEVQALGDGTITTAAGTWEYDAQTCFVYADLGWEDDFRDDANIIGVREFDKDFWRVSDYGTFRPAGFFNPAEVGPEADKVYSSVQAAVVTSDGILADYVYVLRQLW